MAIKRKCLFCGKEFYTKLAIVKAGYGKYCSHSCCGKNSSFFFTDNWKNWRKTQKGEKHHNWKGGKQIIKCQFCGKEFENYLSNKKGKHQFCSKKCVDNARIGQFIGDKNPCWRGGTTPIIKIIRLSEKYKKWRKAVFERDNYTCQISGMIGGKLCVDHIKPLSLIVRENNIKTSEEAYNCKEIWDIKNGRTLAMIIHFQTPTYGFNTKNYL